MDHVECVITGAGVVGLAVARALSQLGIEVLVLEAERTIGSGISSRNSEVIHAGIYYEKNSLKALHCVRGKQLLYEYCVRKNIPFRPCGKIIVATDDVQMETLDAIRMKASENGVHDLTWLSRAQVAQLEPEIQCSAALMSPSTGIIDSHAFMLNLHSDIENNGGIIAFSSPLVDVEIENNRFLLRVGGTQPCSISASIFVNSAGLFAPALARRIKNLAADKIPPAFYAKGNYFSLSGKANFSRLIYPVPVQAGLGVHLTIDMNGRPRFGPDVEWIDEPDYRVTPHRSEDFYSAIRKYWPALPDGALAPDYAGIRPKISGPGQTPADFRIDTEDFHGISGLINLFGIESPGLTSSLSIAEQIGRLIGKN